MVAHDVQPVSFAPPSYLPRLTQAGGCGTVRSMTLVQLSLSMMVSIGIAGKYDIISSDPPELRGASCT